MFERGMTEVTLPNGARRTISEMRLEQSEPSAHIDDQTAAQVIRSLSATQSEELEALLNAKSIDDLSDSQKETLLNMVQEIRGKNSDLKPLLRSHKVHMPETRKNQQEDVSVQRTGTLYPTL